MCKENLVTTDFRTFVFMENYDSTLPGTANRYHSIIEVINTAAIPFYSYTMIV
jgi:hypothetical protein